MAWVTNSLSDTAKHQGATIPPDVSPAMRGLIFTLVLMAHGIALALVPYIKTAGSGDDSAPGVLQVRWVEKGEKGGKVESTPSTAAPAPEIAPEPLPMRPKPAVVQPKAHPQSRPVLAINSDIPSPESLPTSLPNTASANESLEASSKTSSTEMVSNAMNEGTLVASAGAPSGAQSGTQSGAAGFIEPGFAAAYLSNPHPEYPPLSRRLSEQGTVTLNIHVTAEGKADKVVLQQSSGFERLDKAASDVVWRWRFTPARQGGKNVAAWVLVPIQFTLRG